MGPRTVNGKEGSFITAIRVSSNLEGESKDTSPQARRNNCSNSFTDSFGTQKSGKGHFSISHSSQISRQVQSG